MKSKVFSSNGSKITPNNSIAFLPTVICSNVSKKNLWEDGIAKIVILPGILTVRFANIMLKFTKNLPLYVITVEFIWSPSGHFLTTLNWYMKKSRISNVTIVMRFVFFSILFLTIYQNVVHFCSLGGMTISYNNF